MRRPHLREEIDELCRRTGIDACIRTVASPHETLATVRAALDSGPAVLVAAGGDGTVSAAAAGVSGTDIPLGVLPLGTLNHFAKDAGIPTDLPKAVHVIAAGHTRRVDVGRVNDRIFVNNASIGVYPRFVEVRDQFRTQGRSRLSALALAAAEILRREGEVVIRLQGDRTRILARTPFVFVGNNEYLAEGLTLGGRTRLDEGLLHAYYAPPVRTRDLPRLFGQALFGRARRDHALRSMSAAEMWVDTFTHTVGVACDGELLTLASPLRFRSWPHALALLCPSG